jgi:hypothetical protein
MKEILRTSPHLTRLSIDQIAPNALAAIKCEQLRSLSIAGTTPHISLEDLSQWVIPASLTEVQLPIPWSPTPHTLRKLAELTPEDRRCLNDVSGLFSGILKYQELDSNLRISDLSGIPPGPIIRQQKQLANDMHEKSISATTLAARLQTASMLSTADAVSLQKYLYEYSGFWHPLLKEHLYPYEILQAEAARVSFLNIVQEAQQ